MPLKTAIVVFVRNEYPDFCAWLAWYFALGADTILVYDDHSTDGTWEAAMAASRVLDVRVFRTDLSIQPFTARQRDVYLGAIRSFRDEFDWIGFFDADEFLHLRHNLSLPSFLERFPEAGAVAISWCIYGSSGHLLKPETTTVEAFTRHSLPEFEHNRSVKSFVRPRNVIDRWRDPHTFEIGERLYADAQGEPVRWGGPGAIAHVPDWSTAKLMHYIPRSMEHFIERIRRRSDLRGLTNEYWNVFNKNDLEDTEPLARLPDAKRKLFLINSEVMRQFCRSLASSALGSPASKSVFKVQIVATHFQTVLAVDQSKSLLHAPADTLSDNGLTPVFALSNSTLPNVLHLVASQLEGPLLSPHDPRVSDVLTYVTQWDANRIFTLLKRPNFQRYLTAIPPGPNRVGSTSSDRWQPSEWEQFTLEPTSPPDHVLAAYQGIAQISDDASVVRAMAQSGIAPMICASAISVLSESERERLSRMTATVLPASV